MPSRKTPDIVGLHEAAELLGISKTALAERRRAGTFPEPAVKLRCGPIWRKADVEKHARTYAPSVGGWENDTHRNLRGAGGPNYRYR